MAESEERERERDRIHETIWKIANELRGSIDGWDFKQYVLGTLFYRFLSENLENYVDRKQHEAGYAGFSYGDVSDEEAQVGRKDICNALGYFILPSQLFYKLVKESQDADAGDLNLKLDKIFTDIVKSTSGLPSQQAFEGLFDEFDVTSKKLGSTPHERYETLAKLLSRVAEFKLSDFPESGRDTFGDAYEYLMTMYAANAGKSGGEFFTPPEVGELLARISLIDPKDPQKDRAKVKSVYDPTCGSGGLLLKFAKILGTENVDHFYGQDKALTVYNLCRMNMILHRIPFSNFEIKLGDTLINPYFPATFQKDRFECIVSNPPYSLNWKSGDDPTLINDPRFESAGRLAPKNAADYAFIEHALYCLSNTGCAAIVVFPGVLHRGNAEKTIREWLVKNNFIDTIIQLPANLFFGTQIATSILVLRKNKKDDTILFINAKEEFKHYKNQNKLESENIDRILERVRKRNDVKGMSHLADFAEVEANDFNLSVQLYIAESDAKKEIDIDELNRQIKETVQKEEELRKAINSLINGVEI